MLEYPLWFTFFLGIAAILLGAGDENYISISFPKAANKFAKTGFILLLILGLANLSTMLIANIKLENWMHKLAYENINEQKNLDWVRQYSLLSPYGELMHAVSMDINADDIDEQLALNQSVMNFRPYRTIAYRHALLLKLQGQSASAVIQLNRALIAYPDKFNSALENTPLKYRQNFLDLLSETQAAKQKNEITAK
jgi:hypothetical protein